MDYQTQDPDDNAPKLPTTSFSDSRYDPAILLENNNFSDWSQNSLQKALKNSDKRSQAIIKKRWLATCRDQN